jgi:hypothetical protein
VMSTRYDAPGAQTAGTGRAARTSDAATMWESLNGGEDPTDDPTEEPVTDDQDDPADAATRR